MLFFVWLEFIILILKFLFSKYILLGIGFNLFLIRLVFLSGWFRVINGGLLWDFIGWINEKG